MVEGNTKILGVTKMKGNAFVEGTFKFKGLADSTTTDSRFLMIRPNGKAESFNKAGLLEIVYSNTCLDNGVNFPAPLWMPVAGNSNPPVTTGVLYTGVDCAARVGIGTSNPIATFDVRGNGSFNSFLHIGNSFPTSITTRLNIAQNNPHKNGIVVNMTNAGSPILTGVGIKTIVANPLRKAMTVVDGNTNKDVFRVYGNGLIEAKKLRLSLNIWSDFVFDKDYDLISLEDLEKYININNHLPSVPTEQEMKEEGLDVAETDALLLQKIEELTLYVIELNKQVQELKKENSNLNTKIESNH